MTDTKKPKGVGCLKLEIIPSGFFQEEGEVPGFVWGFNFLINPGGRVSYQGGVSPLVSPPGGFVSRWSG